MMPPQRYAFLIALICLIVAVPAYAEFETGIYGGAALTNKTDNTQSSSLGITATAHGLKTDPQLTLGGRVGYWFERFDYVGTGLDVFYFRAKAPSQSVPITISSCCSGMGTDSFSLPVVAVAFDVIRLRLPLMLTTVSHLKRLLYFSRIPRTTQPLLISTKSISRSWVAK